MAAEENSWRTSSFRQSVVVKIDEAIQRSGMPTSKNSMEMENHVFQKAKTKEEYLGFVARLILHVREMNSKKAAGMGGPGSGNPAMPDPINALQTLARQGTGNNQMMGMGGPQSGGMVQQPQSQVAAATLLQSLNQRPGIQGNQGLAGLQSLQNKMPDIAMGPGSQIIPVEEVVELPKDAQQVDLVEAVITSMPTNSVECAEKRKFPETQTIKQELTPNKKKKTQLTETASAAETLAGDQKTQIAQAEEALILQRRTAIAQERTATALEGILQAYLKKNNLK